MLKYPYQLTIWSKKSDLLFAEEQLKRYRAKEGIDYEWREEDGKWAIFILKG